MQNNLVAATFPDSQTNTFSLLFKPRDFKFPTDGFRQSGSNVLFLVLIQHYLQELWVITFFSIGRDRFLLGL